MKSKKPLIPYIIWMAVLVVIPLCMVAYYSFTDDSGSFTFGNIRYIIDNGNVYIDSLKIALISTVICLVLAYPIAVIMSRMSPTSQKIMNILLMLPMWMNFILRICSWQIILQPNGVLDKLTSLLTGNPATNGIYGHPIATVIGIVYNYLPFMVLPIYTSIAKISRLLIEAGEDLGCNSWNILKKIIFPLSIPGVMSGITMVFVPAASTVVISMRLTGTALIGDVIESYYIGSGANMHAGSMISLILMIVIFISIAILNRFDKDDDIVLV